MPQSVWLLYPLHPRAASLPPSFEASPEDLQAGYLRKVSVPTGFAINGRPAEFEHPYIYKPTEADIGILGSCCPGATVKDPLWRTIGADLVDAGYDPKTLQGYDAPTLLRLLQKARRLAGPEHKTADSLPTMAEADTPATLQAGAPEQTQRGALSKEAKALAALIDHPDWTDQQIADAAGCNVKSLYRMDKFTVAKKARERGKQDVPTGTKDGTRGDVEAWGTADE